MLTLIDLQANPSFDGQASGDSTDWNAALGGDNGTFVFTGMSVAQHTGSDMECTVALGTYYVFGVAYTSSAAAQVTVLAADSTDRKDIVVAGAGVTLNATHVSGSGAVTSLAVIATLAAIPSGSTLVMANGDQVVTSAPASLGATSISITSQTPSAGAGWVTGTVVAPLWVVKGTDCGTAGWSRTNATSLSTLPPVKPNIPAGACLLSEVYVENTTTAIVTATNLVDKTNVVGLAGQAIGNINMGGFQIVNSGGIIAGQAVTGAGGLTNSNITGLDYSPTVTYTAGQNYRGLNLTEVVTWTTTNWPGSQAHAVNISPTWIVNATGTFTKIVSQTVIISPSVQSNATLSSVNPIFISPSYGYTSGQSCGDYAAVVINGNTLGSVTGQSTALSIGTVGGAPGSNTTATCVALDIGWSTLSQGIDTTDISGPIWASGTGGGFPSWFGGAVLIGNLATISLDSNGAPAAVHYALDLQSPVYNQVGLSKALVQPVIGSVFPTTAPTTPATGAGWFGFWQGATHKYYVMAYNNAGTMTYKYTQMDTTGAVTWSVGATLPA